jgi:hypothetical protein
MKEERWILSALRSLAMSLHSTAEWHQTPMFHTWNEDPCGNHCPLA